MRECICNSCKNLKGIIDENGKVEEYECEFGFPSDDCLDCEDSECELTCNHYICDEEQDNPRIVKCKGCAKEIEQVCGDNDDGDVYCFECYLNKKI